MSKGKGLASRSCTIIKNLISRLDFHSQCDKLTCLILNFKEPLFEFRHLKKWHPLSKLNAQERCFAELNIVFSHPSCIEFFPCRLQTIDTNRDGRLSIIHLAEGNCLFLSILRNQKIEKHLGETDTDMERNCIDIEILRGLKPFENSHLLLKSLVIARKIIEKNAEACNAIDRFRDQPPIMGS